MRSIKNSVIFYLLSLKPAVRGLPQPERRPAATNYVAEALPVKGSKLLTTTKVKKMLI
jgi:hypothetical protein